MNEQATPAKGTTVLGNELQAVITAHAQLMKAAAETAGPAVQTPTFNAPASDSDFLMRQYLAYVRTFLEPTVIQCAKAVEEAQKAAEAAAVQQEAATEEPAKPQWPPAGFEKKD